MSCNVTSNSNPTRTAAVKEMPYRFSAITMLADPFDCVAMNKQTKKIFSVDL